MTLTLRGDSVMFGDEHVRRKGFSSSIGTEARNIIFHEVQQFRQIWLWLIILLPVGILWYGAIQQFVFKQPFGSKPAPDSVLFISWLIVGIALPALFYSSKLITEVRDDGVYLRFFPFHLSFRKIPFDRLSKYEARTYNPLLEYGGWGIRYGWKGKAYNVSGDRGVQLELSNREQILIGSQKPEELAYAIDLALKKCGRKRY
jgi:hypothetical protein